MDQQKKNAERVKPGGVNSLECRSDAEKTAHDQACLVCWMVGGLLLSDISLLTLGRELPQRGTLKQRLDQGGVSLIDQITL